jgi:hypothetical protein
MGVPVVSHSAPAPARRRTRPTSSGRPGAGRGRQRAITQPRLIALFLIAKAVAAATGAMLDTAFGWDVDALRQTP